MTKREKKPAKPEPKTGRADPPEGSEAFRAFKKLAEQVVTVPKEELDRREAATPKRKRSS